MPRQLNFAIIFQCEDNSGNVQHLRFIVVIVENYGMLLILIGLELR